MSTTAIVLAADSGLDFVCPKYLVSVHGEPMLQHVVNDVTDWPVDHVIVVLGSNAEQIIETIDFGDLTVVIDPEWSEGTASPIRAALDLASRDRSTRRCVITRGDQPSIDAEMIEVLIDAATEQEADAAVLKYRYAIGWPIVLDRSVWEHLIGSEGSVDLLDVVVSRASTVAEVWVDHRPPVTFETSEDLP